jgi:hypothetical protein
MVSSVGPKPEVGVGLFRAFDPKVLEGFVLNNFLDFDVSTAYSNGAWLHRLALMSQENSVRFRVCMKVNAAQFLRTGWMKSAERLAENNSLAHLLLHNVENHPNVQKRIQQLVDWSAANRNISVGVSTWQGVDDASLVRFRDAGLSSIQLPLSLVYPENVRLVGRTMGLRFLGAAPLNHGSVLSLFGTTVAESQVLPAALRPLVNLGSIDALYFGSSLEHMMVIRSVFENLSLEPFEQRAIAEDLLARCSQVLNA